MATLFISHSSKDRAATERIGRHLRAWGYESLFLDFDPEDGIAVGRHWERELYLQVRAADAVLFVASGASVSSRWCFAELTLARSEKKEIFPVAIEHGAALPLVQDHQWVDLTNGDGGLERLRRALRERFDPEQVFTWDRTRSPYPGLSPFEAEDAAVFFARDDAVAEVLGHLEATPGARSVAVIGASGSGKSSLVRAGVLPRLRRRGARWVVLPPLKPGERPVAALARSLAVALGTSREAVEPRLESGFGELLRDIAVGPDGSERSVLLVVDQAEELVTLAEAPERTRFLALLAGASSVGGPLRVLVTMRAEYLGASLEDGGLVNGQTVLIGPLDRGRLAEVIVRPARKVAIEFAPGLVERMVDETRGGDALPLLAYTLRELYDRTRVDPHVVAMEEYDAIGGVEGALRRGADRVVGDLRASGREKHMLPTLLRFVTLDASGAAARRRLPASALDDDERAVVKAFVDARLMVSGKPGAEPVFEVVHEALLRVWPPLKAAIDASRERLQLQSELARESQAWNEHKRADSYLLRGERLARARGILASAPRALEDLGDDERVYFEASVALERRQRRRTVMALSVALAVISAAALVSLWALGMARDQERVVRDERDKAQATALASEALARMDEEPSESLALALRAHETADVDLAKGALRLAVSRTAPQTILRGHKWADVVAFAPDGRHVASADRDGVLRVWDRTAPKRPVATRKALDATALRFAPGGNRLVAVTDEGTVHVLDIAREQVETVPSPTEYGDTPAISRDSSTVAIIQDGRVRVWKWSDQPARVTVLPGRVPDESEALVFSATGHRLALGGRDGFIRIWDLRRPKATPVIVGAGGESVDALAFSPDDGRLAGAQLAPDEGTASRRITPNGSETTFRSPETLVRVWDWRERPTRPAELGRVNSVIWDIAFSPDGRHVATAAWEPTVRIWDLRDPDAAATLLHGHTSQVQSVDFATDGLSLVTGSDDGTVRVWDWRAPDPPPVELRGLRSGHGDVAFSPDGRELASITDSRGTVELWDWRRPASPARIPAGGRDAFLARLAYSGDGRYLAAVGEGAIQLWDRRKAGGPEAIGDAKRRFAAVALSRDGRYLAGGAGDGTLHLWDLHDRGTPAVLGTPPPPEPPSPIPGWPREPEPSFDGDVTFAPDGAYLASYDSLDDVALWDLRPPRAKRKPIPSENSESAAAAIAFSPDSRFMAVAGVDQRTRIFDVRALGRAPVVIRGHIEDIRDVAFSGDGRHLATASDDGTIRVTDWRDSRLAPTVLRSNTPALAVAFAPDGRHLAAAGYDGIVRVWDCQRCGDLGLVLARARERLANG